VRRRGTAVGRVVGGAVRAVSVDVMAADRTTNT
jgi:hypothetical protein